jgi:tRNA U34 2-thiouridine synthase MnmA/TrmU
MKAIALISGGLDSILAARVVQGQGVRILPLNFKIPFCHKDRRAQGIAKDKFSLVKDSLGLDLETADISEEFLKLIERPRYGFGSNLNPCIDCKILMLSKAKELMGPEGADFVVTGEVLGQRPMSQHRKALELIEKRSGLEGLVLRPLSARLLPETTPERQGWVSRDKLLDFSGRTRKPQISLAQELGIDNYPNAAGGCLLTDPGFAKRLKDLLVNHELSLANTELLKLGRHFRLAPGVKLVVGRNQEEDELLAGSAQAGDYLFMPCEELAGPTSLARGEMSDGLIRLACQITCRYCDLNGAKEAKIVYRGSETGLIEVAPVDEARLVSLRV